MIAIATEAIVSILGVITFYSICYFPITFIGLSLHFLFSRDKKRTIIVPFVLALFMPLATALPHLIVFFLYSLFPEKIAGILLPRGFWQSIITGQVVGCFILVLIVGNSSLFHRNKKQNA